MTRRAAGAIRGPRARLARAAVALGPVVAGCEPSAEDVIDAAVAVTRAGRPQALVPLLHPDYADTLGDGPRLIRDLTQWFAAHPPASFEAAVVDRDHATASERRLRLRLQIDGSWGGAPEVRIRGRMDVTLERWDALHLRSGWMTDLRDTGQLIRGWEAARRSPSADLVGRLIHPAYDDAFVTHTEARARWLAHGPVDARVTLARLEVREDTAHLDLYELIREGPEPRPAIHRLTLRPVAGRWRISSGLRFGGVRPAPGSTFGNSPRRTK